MACLTAHWQRGNSNRKLLVLLLSYLANMPNRIKHAFSSHKQPRLSQPLILCQLKINCRLQKDNRSKIITAQMHSCNLPCWLLPPRRTSLLLALMEESHCRKMTWLRLRLRLSPVGCPLTYDRKTPERLSSSSVQSASAGGEPPSGTHTAGDGNLAEEGKEDHPRENASSMFQESQVGTWETMALSSIRLLHPPGHMVYSNWRQLYSH